MMARPCFSATPDTALRRRRRSAAASCTVLHTRVPISICARRNSGATWAPSSSSHSANRAFGGSAARFSVSRSIRRYSSSMPMVKLGSFSAMVQVLQGPSTRRQAVERGAQRVADDTRPSVPRFLHRRSDPGGFRPAGAADPAIRRGGGPCSRNCCGRCRAGCRRPITSPRAASAAMKGRASRPSRFHSAATCQGRGRPLNTGVKLCTETKA